MHERLSQLQIGNVVYRGNGKHASVRPRENELATPQALLDRQFTLLS